MRDLDTVQFAAASCEISQRVESCQLLKNLAELGISILVRIEPSAAAARSQANGALDNRISTGTAAKSENLATDQITKKLVISKRWSGRRKSVSLGLDR